MTALPALAFGFMLGMRHATDADHVAAVSTLVAGGPSHSLPSVQAARRAALLGAWWGAGHSVSVLLVGGALVLLRAPMPARLALVLEFLVAVMLVGLGVRSMSPRAPQGVTAVRPFAVGVMHGLAGTAVVALLVLGAAPSAWTAAAWLVSFCVGTIGGMALITALFAIPAAVAPARTLRFERAIRVAAGVASIAVGLALAHRVGVTDGLFAATPSWTPE